MITLWLCGAANQPRASKMATAPLNGPSSNDNVRKEFTIYSLCRVIVVTRMIDSHKVIRAYRATVNVLQTKANLEL